ncbi:MAG: hypothetical protein Q8N90_02545 [bacterium]|nr:hypothetical protein [bacterium]
MLDYEKRQNRFCRNLFFFFLLLAFMLVLCGCSGFVQLHTNLPLSTTKILVVNNTNSHLYILVDGNEKGAVPPAETRTFGFWIGGGAYSSSIQVSVVLLDRQKNRSWSDVVYFSSYYKYSYVFTAREDESGRLQVERR